MFMIACPSCGHNTRVPDEYRGRRVKCPKCDEPFATTAAPTSEAELEDLAAAILCAPDSRAVPPPLPSWTDEVVQERPRPTAIRPPPVHSKKPIQLTFAVLIGLALISAAVAFWGLRPALKANQEQTELQAKQENEKRAMRERERQNEQLERDRIAGEEERKRQEQLKKDEEVGERQERQRKKEDQLRRDRLNPIPATLEHVNNYPEKFYGRILCFDKVKVSGGSIKRNKDLGRFTIGVTSTRGRYYSGVPYDELFFSADDVIGNGLLLFLNDNEQFFHVKLYCEMREFTSRGLVKKTFPEAVIYKAEVFNLKGEVSLTLP